MNSRGLWVPSGMDPTNPRNSRISVIQVLQEMELYSIVKHVLYSFVFVRALLKF